MKRLVYFFILIGVILWFRKEQEKPTLSQKIEKSQGKKTQTDLKKDFDPIGHSAEKKVSSNSSSKHELALKPIAISQTAFAKNSLKEKSPQENLITYTIDDRVAVTQGDMVLGEFQPGALLQALSGQVAEPEIKIWPTREIPYFIQSDVPNQERVQRALEMFNETHVHFISYQDQTDAIVFERSAGVCKSYVGYVGGMQKIFIADACSSREIAHEIMHALGFIHEQNRNDRDAAVEILWDNIDPSRRVNFEKFSPEAMRVSGLTKFDFESLMIYPNSMFSINGQPTMRATAAGQVISPKSFLSVKDIERINEVY